MRTRQLSMLAFGIAVSSLVGCSRDEGRDPGAGAILEQPAPDVLEGSLLVDGQAVRLQRCLPGANVHIFVEVATSAGVLRFEDQRMSWDGEPLTCTRLDRSWGGGRRPSGGAYWRGTLDFACRAGARTFAGELRLDCGGITAEERAQLDAQRAKIRGPQAAEPDSR